MKNSHIIYKFTFFGDILKLLLLFSILFYNQYKKINKKKKSFKIFKKSNEIIKFTSFYLIANKQMYRTLKN